MNIAGYIKNSFVDYPGQISAVVFTQGCNYDCFFCHNRLLIPFDGELTQEEEIFEFLKKRVGLLDAVVISGGEPTLQKDLQGFIEKVRELGFLIKLDTNGSRPEVLEMLLEKELLDYVAMDYKAPFARYDEICCAKCDTQAVRRSMDIVKKSGIAYELRTTYVPQLTENDIETMLREADDIHTFALQRYKMPAKYKNEHRFLLKSPEHTELEYENAHKKAMNFAKKAILR